MVPEDPSRKFVNPGKFFKPPTGYDMIARERLYAKLQEGSKIPLTHDPLQAQELDVRP